MKSSRWYHWIWIHSCHYHSIICQSPSGRLRPLQTHAVQPQQSICSSSAWERLRNIQYMWCEHPCESAFAPQILQTHDNTGSGWFTNTAWTRPLKLIYLSPCWSKALIAPPMMPSPRSCPTTAHLFRWTCTDSRDKRWIECGDSAHVVQKSLITSSVLPVTDVYRGSYISWTPCKGFLCWLTFASREKNWAQNRSTLVQSIQTWLSNQRWQDWPFSSISDLPTDLIQH